MDAPPVSIVVASHDRPTWLVRCLTALGQVDYPNFEIVIAADRLGIASVERHPYSDLVKVVHSDVPNISQTRNLGIEEASGDILAFIDDDAVPEPMWLHHHVEALEGTGSAASVGYVRGRNGISFQSKGHAIDSEAETHDLAAPGVTPWVPELTPGCAAKLVGTNFAIRRADLDAIGLFDPAFRFFLDDSDLSLRLAQSGRFAAIVPLAEVHHAFAPSVRRTQNRFPKRLVDIGRSTAVFVRKHEPSAIHTVKERVFKRERDRLIMHMVRGNCEPRDVGECMAGLRAGWEEGEKLNLLASLPKPTRNSDFKHFPRLFDGHGIKQSRLLGRTSSILRGRNTVASGRRASVFSFSLTARPHRLRFTRDGVWVQTGGQFGRSDRDDAFWRWCRFAHRVKLEVARVELQRCIGEYAGVWGNER